MKTLKTDYNLQNITESPEVYLSDLFIILFSSYILEKRGVVASKYSFNKLFPFLFDQLEKQDKLDKIQVFNLPFYKMDQGHYNKSLITSYLSTLIQAGLIQNRSKIEYELTNKGEKIIKAYYENEDLEEKQEIENLITEYSIRFLEKRDLRDIYEVLRTMSHTMLVEDNGKKVAVDDLDTDDFKAISYNNKDFKKGKVSSLVPETYLEELAHELQENTVTTTEAIKAVENLLVT